MNYFEFYEIPISFVVDKGALKKTFYSNSKKYHPDFYTLESEEKQGEVLRLSTLNNKAYKVLNDFDKRMKYILDLKSVLEEEGKNQIPQEFLMEMMDINEALMELEFDFDAAKRDKVQADLESLQESLYNPIAEMIESYDDSEDNEQNLKKIKEYYLKKRYLLRIRENLDKFASK